MCSDLLTPACIKHIPVRMEVASREACITVRDAALKIKDGGYSD